MELQPPLDKEDPLFFILKEEEAYHRALELDILAYPEAMDQR